MGLEEISTENRMEELQGNEIQSSKKDAIPFIVGGACALALYGVAITLSNYYNFPENLIHYISNLF